ncbi:hypothetical protein GYMLUDRAFT_37901 [Collybiopsis luxurians FD-317 M1]|nr:hypothetical protein GYMLUDRAFT_37901 [Collybiopsis luxurians FD-317 M1]
MSSTTNTKKLRVAIIGGGIGGLTFAVALKGCRNIEVNLYEQAHQITEIGAGIGVWHRTWEVLKSLELDKELTEQLQEEPNEDQKPSFEFRLGDRKNGFTFQKIYVKGGVLLFHRQEIQGTLLKNVPDFCKIHLSHRLIQCEEREDSVKLIFENGAETTCDILVGADGVKSAARQGVPNDGFFYPGYNVIRGLIPRDVLAKAYPGHRNLEDPVIYCGKNQHIVAYPISHGQLINVAAFTFDIEAEGKPYHGPGIKPVTNEEIVDAFSGWEDEVVQLLKSIEQPTRWVLRDLHPMDTYVTRRIALLGDAAHAMLPHLGSGMGQAVEDGYILGRLLSHANPQNWLRAVEAYNLVRQPFGNMVKSKSREQGFYYELNVPEFENIKAKGQDLTPDQVHFLSKTIEKNWSWMEDGVDNYLQIAYKFLEQEKNHL